MRPSAPMPSLWAQAGALVPPSDLHLEAATGHVRLDVRDATAIAAIAAWAAENRLSLGYFHGGGSAAPACAWLACLRPLAGVALVASHVARVGGGALLGEVEATLRRGRRSLGPLPPAATTWAVGEWLLGRADRQFQRLAAPAPLLRATVVRDGSVAVLAAPEPADIRAADAVIDVDLPCVEAIARQAAIAWRFDDDRSAVSALQSCASFEGAGAELALLPEASRGSAALWSRASGATPTWTSAAAMRWPALRPVLQALARRRDRCWYLIAELDAEPGIAEVLRASLDGQMRDRGGRPVEAELARELQFARPSQRPMAECTMLQRGTSGQRQRAALPWSTLAEAAQRGLLGEGWLEVHAPGSVVAAVEELVVAGEGGVLAALRAAAWAQGATARHDAALLRAAAPAVRAWRAGAAAPPVTAAITAEGEQDGGGEGAPVALLAPATPWREVVARCAAAAMTIELDDLDADVDVAAVVFAAPAVRLARALRGVPAARGRQDPSLDAMGWVDAANGVHRSVDSLPSALAAAASAVRAGAALPYALAITPIDLAGARDFVWRGSLARALDAAAVALQRGEGLARALILAPAGGAERSEVTVWLRLHGRSPRARRCHDVALQAFSGAAAAASPWPDLGAARLRLGPRLTAHETPPSGWRALSELSLHGATVLLGPGVGDDDH